MASDFQIHKSRWIMDDRRAKPSRLLGCTDHGVAHNTRLWDGHRTTLELRGIAQSDLQCEFPHLESFRIAAQGLSAVPTQSNPVQMRVADFVQAHERHDWGVGDCLQENETLHFEATETLSRR